MSDPGQWAARRAGHRSSAPIARPRAPQSPQVESVEPEGRHDPDHRGRGSRPPPRGPPGARPDPARPVGRAGAVRRSVAGRPRRGRPVVEWRRSGRRDRGAEGRRGHRGHPRPARGAARARLRRLPRGRLSLRLARRRPARARGAGPDRAGRGARVVRPCPAGRSGAPGALRAAGGPGSPHRRDRARLQQPPVRDHRPDRARPAPAQPRPPGLRPARPGTPRGRARRRAEPPAARLRPRLTRGSLAGRSQRGGGAARPHAAAGGRRGLQVGGPRGPGAGACPGRRHRDGAARPEPRPERPRRHAAGRAADHRDA